MYTAWFSSPKYFSVLRIEIFSYITTGVNFISYMTTMNCIYSINSL